MAVTVEVKGLKQLQFALGELTPDIALAVRQQINAGALAIERTVLKSIRAVSPGTHYKRKGQPMVRSVAGDAPNVMDGNLRKLIKVTTSKGLITKGYFATIHSGAMYSQFLEKGTSKMRARPFMKPAFDKHKDQIAKRIAKAVNGAIPKTKGKK